MGGRVKFLRRSSWQWLAGIPILSAMVGCAGKADTSSAPVTQSPHYPGSFRIQEVASGAGAGGTKKVWLATAVHGESSARFRIELLLKAQQADAPFASTQGALVREEGSDGTWFLGQLAQVLAAKTIPEKAAWADRLEFDAAILGWSLSREVGTDQVAGSFTSNPPGHWIAVKVFVADGEGEFFLNLNPVDCQGEVSIKDADYGDIVVRELAKILLPGDGGLAR
jgi:hypothetical protein